MKSLSKKAFLYTLIITVFSIFLLDTFFYLNTKDFLSGEIKTELNKQIKLARKIIDINAFNERDYKKLKYYSDEISRLTGSRTTLIAKDGKVLADSELDSLDLNRAENHLNRPEIKEAMEKGIGFSERRSATIDKNLLYYAENLYEGNRISGFIRFAVFSTNIDTRLEFLTNMLIIIDFFVLLIVFGFLIIWQKKVKKQTESLITEISLRSEQPNFTDIPSQKYAEYDKIASGVNSLGKNLFNLKERYKQSFTDLLGLFNSLHEGVAAFDKNGRLLFFNKPFSYIFNTENAVEGKSFFYDLIHFPPLINDIHKFLKSNSLVTKRTKYSGSRYIEYQISQFNLEDLQAGFIITVEDVTNLQNLEIIRQDFVANVSHEFKTPLTSIRGYAETLLSGSVNDSVVQKKFLEKIEKQTLKLENIVTDLLQLTRIENREVEEHTEIDPVSTLKEIADDFSFRCKAKKIDFTTDFLVNSGEVKILANPQLLQTLVSNLLANAINYNSEKGSVIFKCSANNKYFIAEVADTGIGIPKDEKQRIFERFYRVDSSRSVYPEGSGLGLSIVKNITELFRGKIELESEPGKGSRFVVYIPLV